MLPARGAFPLPLCDVQNNGTECRGECTGMPERGEEPVDDMHDTGDVPASLVGSAGMLQPRGQEVQTFLIADIRGYTQFTHEHGDEAAARLARVFALLTRTTVEDHGGALT